MQQHRRQQQRRPKERRGQPGPGRQQPPVAAAHDRDQRHRRKDQELAVGDVLRPPLIRQPGQREQQPGRQQPGDRQRQPQRSGRAKPQPGRPRRPVRPVLQSRAEPGPHQPATVLLDQPDRGLIAQQPRVGVRIQRRARQHRRPLRPEQRRREVQEGRRRHPGQLDQQVTGGRPVGRQSVGGIRHVGLTQHDPLERLAARGRAGFGTGPRVLRLPAREQASQADVRRGGDDRQHGDAIQDRREDGDPQRASERDVQNRVLRWGRSSPKGSSTASCEGSPLVWGGVPSVQS